MQKQVWLLRALAALLMMMGLDFLTWAQPLEQPWTSWLLRIPVYLSAAAVLLDWVVRYRVRDLFGMMTLAGCLALLLGVLIHPDYVFTDMPRTFITRMMGAQALLLLEMQALFLYLTGRVTWGRWLPLFTSGIGAVWGAWVRWWPADAGVPEVSAPVMLSCAVGMAMVLILWSHWGPRYTTKVTQASLLLGQPAWAVIGLIYAAVASWQVARGAVELGWLLVIGALLVLCFAMLWFRARQRGKTLFDGHVPPLQGPVQPVIVSCALFILAAGSVFQLPLIQLGDLTPLSLIGLGFTAYGLAWLPTVAVILGLQAYLRQINQNTL